MTPTPIPQRYSTPTALVNPKLLALWWDTHDNITANDYNILVEISFWLDRQHRPQNPPTTPTTSPTPTPKPVHKRRDHTRRRWNPTEDAYLKTNWGKTPTSQMKAVLGRTRGSIYARAYVLKLRADGGAQ